MQHHTDQVDGLTRREVTYKELFQLLQKLAAGLCEVGVRVGDRVAVVCVNSIEQVVSLLAILYAGAVPVPINPTYTSCASSSAFMLAS